MGAKFRLVVSATFEVLRRVLAVHAQMDKVVGMASRFIPPVVLPILALVFKGHLPWGMNNLYAWGLSTIAVLLGLFFSVLIVAVQLQMEKKATESEATAPLSRRVDIWPDFGQFYKVGPPSTEGFPNWIHALDDDSKRIICIDFLVSASPPTRSPESVGILLNGERLISPWWKSSEDAFASTLYGPLQERMFVEIPELTNGGSHRIHLTTFVAGRWWDSADSYEVALPDPTVGNRA